MDQTALNLNIIPKGYTSKELSMSHSIKQCSGDLEVKKKIKINTNLEQLLENLINKIRKQTLETKSKK